MKKIKLFSLPALAVVIGLYSCSKGDTGATGAKGPAGPDSVYYSTWTTIAFTGAYADGDSSYGQVIPAANLTEGILDSGVVLSYIGQQGSGGFTDVAPVSEFGLFEDYEVGSITYSTSPTSEGGIGTSENGYLALRYVLIPGSVLATSSTFKSLTKAQIKSMSYNSVLSALGAKGNEIKNN